jgi:hypothetical protein
LKREESDVLVLDTGLAFFTVESKLTKELVLFSSLVLVERYGVLNVVDEFAYTTFPHVGLEDSRHTPSLKPGMMFVSG